MIPSRRIKKINFFLISTLLLVLTFFLMRNLQSFGFNQDLSYFYSSVQKKDIAGEKTFPVNKNSVLDLDVKKLPEEREAYEELYERYARSVEVECAHSERLGHHKEGGWSVCLQGNFKLPLSCKCSPSCPCTPTCLVYSFGINDDWSFDEDIVKRFNCYLRAFDPSLNETAGQRGERITFYKEGLAGSEHDTEDEWKMRTLGGFLKKLKESETVIDFLKIDIEHWEWESLQTAIKQGALRNVKQLGIEVHRDEIMFQRTSLSHYKTFLNIFLGLREAGFYKWYSHLNPLSVAMYSISSGDRIDCCHEFVYLNLNFQHSKSSVDHSFFKILK